MLRLRTQVTVVADDAPAQVVGDLGHGADLAAPGREQGDDLVLAGLLAGGDAVEHLAHRGPGACGSRVGERASAGSTDGAAVPRRVAPADLHDLGAGAGVDGLLDPLGEHRAGVVAAEALGVGAVEHGEAQRRVEPALGVERRTRGRSVRRGASSKPAASVAARRRSSAGHGRSGLTWSAVTGETPPQSSMPAASRSPSWSSDRLGGACRCDLGRAGSRGPGRWRRGTRRAGTAAHACIAVPGFGRKFWTITSCTWPWRRWLAAIASSASMRSARSSPMPTRIPVVNGMAQLAGGLEGGAGGARAPCRARRGGRRGRRGATRPSSPGSGATARRRGELVGRRGRRRWRGGAGRSRRGRAAPWRRGSRRSSRSRARRATSRATG